MIIDHFRIRKLWSQSRYPSITANTLSRLNIENISASVLYRRIGSSDTSRSSDLT